jgi:hypothetical protein
MEETTKNESMETKTVERPIIATKPSAKQKVRFVVIGIGQGGARIGNSLVSVLPNNPEFIAINTSEADLKRVNIPDDYKFKIGGENADGAGKNRARAKAFYKNFKSTNVEKTSQTLDVLSTFVGLYEEVLFHPTEQTIIITSFSSDGGTGSGLGPVFTASLANYMNNIDSFQIGKTEFKIDDLLNEIPRPVVIGLTSRCSLTAGGANLQNTIENFLEIQKYVNLKNNNGDDCGVGHFFIADNNLPASVKYDDTDEMYKIINARIAAPFMKFFGVEMNSDLKCLDLQDKINTLRIPGCSAFATITKENQFAYVIPRGQSVTRTVFMLRHDVENLGLEETNAKNMLNANDIMSFDTISAFFDLEKSGIEVNQVAQDLVNASMVGFFGFKSLGNIVEDLRDNLHRAEQANDKKANVILEHSTGFNSVEADNAKMNNRFTSKVVDQKSLIDLV